MRANDPPKSAALLGLAFDAKDGETRLTRGKNFVLLGGSAQTHSKMQETAIRINEELNKSGRRMEDVSLKEFRDVCYEVAKSLRDR